LTLEEYCRVVDDIVELQPHVVFTLTGGEPLLNADCFAIARYIRARGCRVYLLSNGLLIRNNNIATIAQLFDLVTLSIDGPTREVHARTRGDNFDRVIAATQLLETHGVNYTLSMTVTQQNIAYIEAMAQRFGNRLNFAPYFPISGEVSSLSITGVDYFRALKQAQGVRPLGCCEQALEGAIGSPCHKCAIGDGEFSISATGDVYPCQLLHTETFYAGNVHEQSIGDIYRHATALERCARLDVDTMEGCRTCPIKYICGGSCRARAYYGCGDVAAASDFCTYEREAFYDGIVALYAQNGVDEDIR
jgi:radical SAM protein with 4Fe4S-binding SPASM domain